MALTINLEKLVTPEHKFEQRKAEKVAAVEKHGDSIIIGQGYPFHAGEVLGVQHLQTRNNTDRTNWLTSQNAYQAQIAAGNGAVEGVSIRTAENNTVTMTFQEGYDLLLGMAAWGAHMYQVSWAKKDAIRACTTQAELDAIDPTEGWEV